MPSSRALSWSGVRPGLSASTRAAAPLAMAALNEVPEPTKLPAPMRAEGFSLSIVEPGAATLTTERPEVTRSGLTQPSIDVGPALLKLVISSFPVTGWARSSRAPTVITSGSSPGDRMVPLVGPALPAEATTAMPEFQAASTARSSGLMVVDSNGR